MLTDDDINKLKKIFATKEDLKNFATKDDLKQFATKKDLDKRTDVISKEIAQLVDVMNSLIQPMCDKLDDALHELKTNRIILGNHEERIQKIEHKYSS